MGALRFILFPIALVLAGCGGPKTGQAASQKKSAEAPVVIGTVEKKSIPLEIRAIGSIEAYSIVEVKSQISGQIARMLFEPGQEVREGQVLFEIDPRPLQQAVREMEAELANRRAALGQAEANAARDLAQAKNAEAQAKRYTELTNQGIISRDQNEQIQTAATATRKVAAATQSAIESAWAAIQGAEARVADARLQLNFATIRAPINGRTGNVMRKVGNLVSPNSEPLVVLNQITPIYATFTIPEQVLPELRRYSGGARLAVTATPQGGTEADGAVGYLEFLDNTVETASGTILLKAQFANKDRKLWPGQFVNVSVRMANPLEIVVPSSAVRTAQQGNYVFVVKPDSTAEQRIIKISRTFNDFTVVQSGVNPGEKVIVEGQLRVTSGTKVRPRSSKTQPDQAGAVSE